MVSNARPERARALTVVVAGTLVAAASALGGACSRRQNLVDEPDSGSSVRTPPSCDGGVPEVVDSGILSEELTACPERPIGNCQGSNDFPCEFEFWFGEVVAACQERIDCPAAGCVEAEMGEDGCVSSLNMTEPDPAFVACLIENFGAYRCPCGTTSARRFLGVTNTGCRRPCGTGEFTCYSGETCVDGFCEPGGAGGGG
jgi:hypothetical protein